MGSPRTLGSRAEKEAGGRRALALCTCCFLPSTWRVWRGFLSQANKANSYRVIAILLSCSSLSQILIWEVLERQIYPWHHPNSILSEASSQRRRLTPEKAVGFSFWYFPKFCVHVCAHACVCSCVHICFRVLYLSDVQTHNAYSQGSYGNIYVCMCVFITYMCNTQSPVCQYLSYHIQFIQQTFN